MITKNYIKMCKQIGEIQKEWKPELGDWFYNKEIDDCIIILGFTKESRVMINKGTWLPTQEQLQEMLIDDGKGYENVISMIYYFQVWLNEKFYGYFMHKDYPKGNILNELWLAFVMKEKYDKVWDGEKWK